MRLIDIAVFLIVFQTVGTVIINYYGGEIWMKEMVKVNYFGGRVTEQTLNEEWNKIQTIANAILSVNFLVGAIISTVFGYYFFSIAFASAIFVINFVPFIRNYFSTLPTLLLALGVPSSFTTVIVTLYNLFIIIAVLMWLSGRGD